MADASSPLRYRMAGFDVASDIAFPQMDANDGRGADTPFDVTFTTKPTGGIVDGLTFRRNSFACTAFQGNCVAISVLPGADRGAVGRTVPIAGLNAVAYQRGLLPLHASAVEVGDRCVAFCGEAGAGKSTLAAMLAAMGYPLVGDDLVVVHPPGTEKNLAGEGDWQVWPGVRRSKLTRESLSLAGKATSDADVAAWDGKALAAIGAPARDVAHPLAAIYLLRWGEPELRTLTRLEACVLLDQCLRSAPLIARSTNASAIRRRWLELVAAVPTIVATRRRQRDEGDAFVRRLIALWQGDDNSYRSNTGSGEQPWQR